jgi:uncharacterized protein (TIGR02145 family)
MKIIIFILLSILCLTTFGQGISVRLFQTHDDTVFEGHLYKIARIGYVKKELNGSEYIDWKLWFLNDLRPYEKNNLLNMDTQKDMFGVGLFINANYDSIYFNPSGATHACPTKWRVPRIGEWDTLFNMLSLDMKMYMFNELPGYVSYNIVKDDTIAVKKVDKLYGGFWWSSDLEGERCWGIRLDNQRNKEKGKGSLHDRAAVRCVRDEE